jgi:LysR family transcriptional regulator, regulator for bpeEF and oprC
VIPTEKGLDFNRLKVFVAIVDQGSFTQAALQLRQPKSRVSRALTLLERDLEVTLLHRTTRQMQLTDAGREVYAVAKDSLQRMERTLGELRRDTDTLSGLIRVSAPEDLSVVLMAEICDGFLRLYPDIHFDLRVENDFVDLFKEKVDVAIRVGASQEGRLIQKKIKDVSLCWVASPHFLSLVKLPPALKSVPPSWLLHFHSSELSPSWNPSLGLFRKEKSPPPMVCNNFFVLKDLAVRGRGIALVSEIVCREELRQGKLVKIFKAFEEDPLYLVSPHGKSGPKRVKVFLDYLFKELSLRL